MNLSGATDTEEKENVTCGFCPKGRGKGTIKPKSK